MFFDVFVVWVLLIIVSLPPFSKWLRWLIGLDYKMLNINNVLCCYFCMHILNDGDLLYL